MSFQTTIGYCNGAPGLFISGLPQSYSALQIIKKALYTLRLVFNYQPIGYNLLPRKSTLEKLQAISEAILSRKLDRSNFNRKMLSCGIVQKEG